MAHQHQLNGITIDQFCLTNTCARALNKNLVNNLSTNLKFTHFRVVTTVVKTYRKKSVQSYFPVPNLCVALLQIRICLPPGFSGRVQGKPRNTGECLGPSTRPKPETGHKIRLPKSNRLVFVETPIRFYITHVR